MISAIKIIGFSHLRCMGHTVNLIVKRGLASIQKIANLYEAEIDVETNEETYENAAAEKRLEENTANLKAFQAGK